jgi:amphi-Trp domain-containing protein
MRRSKESFKHESLHDTKSVQQILKALTKGVAKGRLTFADDDGEIVMQPEGLLNLKITASQDETRNRVNIRISWQTEDNDKPRKPLSVR